MGSMRRYGSTALQFYELYHRKHDSIAALIEGGCAYGSMALLEPITSYLATGGFPDVKPWSPSTVFDSASVGRDYCLRTFPPALRLGIYSCFLRPSQSCPSSSETMSSP
jgi:hypothetical protein